MQYQDVLGHVWLLLSAFGICFALLSCVEDVLAGHYAKAVGALLGGLLVYRFIGRSKR